jgi:hypothetical protein
MTKAERRKVSLRNLAKARSAKKRKGGGSKRGRKPTVHRKSVRKAGRRTVAMRNLKKAHSARRRAKAAGRKHKVRAYSYRRPAKTVVVKGHSSFEASESRPKRRRGRKPSRRRRSHAREMGAQETRKTRKTRRRGRGRRKLSMSKSAVAARRRRRHSAREMPRKRRRGKSRRHSVRGHYARTKSGRRVRVRKHMSHEAGETRRTRRRRSRRGFAMENPLTGEELLVGGFTGVLGFVAADALDRVLATHALGTSTTGSVGTDGKPLYGDTPLTTGAYTGLYNATAILAPMNVWRWVAGVVGMTGVPLVIAAFIKNPVGRSALQFFAFGAGMRVLGKAADDLMAYLFGRTSWGARLYDGEARAAALKSTSGTGVNSSGQNVMGNFPTTGLGSLGANGCGCVNCTTGVGACCRMTGSRALPAPPGVPQSAGQPPNNVVPSPAPVPMMPAPSPMPVTPAPAPQQMVPSPAPVPMFPAPTPAPAPFTPPTLSPPYYGAPQAPAPRMFQGVPRNADGRRSSFDWGSRDDQAAE